MATPPGFIPDAPAGFVPDRPAVPPPIQTPPSAPTPTAPPVVPLLQQMVRDARSAIPDPLSVAGKALGVLRTPVKAAFDLAGRADVASGIKTPEQAASRANTYANIPIPMLTAALTGGQSLPVQAMTQMAPTAAMQEGGLEPKSPLNVAISGALPFGMAGLGRLLRGLPRMATRLIPSRFREAQEGAQAAGAGLVERLEPAAVTGDLFKGARAAAAERVPAARLTAMLDDLEATIPATPTSPALKTTRELMDQARAAIQGDEIPLGELMKLRLDAGQSLKRGGPTVSALYKGILGDLDYAGAAGGPGATLALRALEAGRKEHGAQLVRELIEKSSTRTNLTGDLPRLDMAKLAKGIQANKEQLIKQVGADGFGQIEEFLVKYRALPPVDAYNFANKAMLGGTGGLGFLFGGGLPGAVGGAAAYELLNNALAVGKNPAELNRALIMLGEGLRAGIAGTAKAALESRR